MQRLHRAECCSPDQLQVMNADLGCSALVSRTLYCDCLMHSTHSRRWGPADCSQHLEAQQPVLQELQHVCLHLSHVLAFCVEGSLRGTMARGFAPYWLLPTSFLIQKFWRVAQAAASTQAGVTDASDSGCISVSCSSRGRTSHTAASTSMPSMTAHALRAVQQLYMQYTGQAQGGRFHLIFH